MDGEQVNKLFLPWSIQHGDTVIDARGNVVALIGMPDRSHEDDVAIAAFIARSANASVENGARIEREEISATLDRVTSDAIRAYREEHGCSLHAAKDAIDAQVHAANEKALESLLYEYATEVHEGAYGWRLSSEWSSDREAVQRAMRPGERFVVRRRRA
jgi:ribosomal protein L7/L12